MYMMQLFKTKFIQYFCVRATFCRHELRLKIVIFRNLNDWFYKFLLLSESPLFQVIFEDMRNLSGNKQILSLKDASMQERLQVCQKLSM